MNRGMDVVDPDQLQPVTTGSGPVRVKTGPEPVAISLATIGNRSIPVLVRLPKMEKIKRPVRVRLHQK